MQIPLILLIVKYEEEKETAADALGSFETAGDGTVSKELRC